MKKQLTTNDICKYVGCNIKYHTEDMIVNTIHLSHKQVTVYNLNQIKSHVFEPVRLNISECKLILRNIENITDDEFNNLYSMDILVYKTKENMNDIIKVKGTIWKSFSSNQIDYLRSIHICVDQYLIDNDLIVWSSN